MLLETWGDTLTASFQRMWAGIINYVPNIVFAVIIFVAGWIIGSVVGRVVADLVRALKVDNLFRSLGTEEVLARAGFKLDIGLFIGGLIKWFIILGFLVAAVDALNLDQINEYLKDILGYLPNVVVAAVILIVAGFLAQAAQRLISGSARAAGVVSATLMGGVAKWAIWIFAILAALEQLKIASTLAQSLGTGIVYGIIGMVSIAGGIAFGLGGKDTAARYLERLRKDISAE